MKIDISELLNHRAESVTVDYCFDPDHVDEEAVPLSPDVKIPEGGIHVYGEVTDNFGCLTLDVEVTAKFVTSCARCLDEVEDEVVFDFQRVILIEPRLSAQTHVSADGEWDGELDDIIYTRDAKIIPDAGIIEELSLSIPVFTLCRDDCPGLCPKCGKKKDSGECQCVEEKKINPKLAILQKLLDNQDQV